jgi:trehalose 6-phosphate synthase/phosphatase
VIAQVFASRYVSELLRARSMLEKKYHQTIPSIQDTNLSYVYGHAHRRLILLDYDEALSTSRKRSELSAPTQSVICMLKALTQDPKNKVYILSGHSVQMLDLWFSSLPGLGLM